jgi:hypothetical protein
VVDIYDASSPEVLEKYDAVDQAGQTNLNIVGIATILTMVKLKQIMLALLAHDDLLKKNLLDYFVLFNPKDIVSGDFYWATEHMINFI